MTAAHPAKFSDPLMPVFQKIIDDFVLDCPEFLPAVLDPFAGTGRIHELKRCRTVGVEIEPEWAEMNPRTMLGDATQLPGPWAGFFDMVLTSPTYGNRMADSHTPGPNDTSTRITYTHKLGRPLHPNNTGQMQWGRAYKRMHMTAWLEAKRVLRPGGLFVLNIRNHYRAGELVDVSAWHYDVLVELGFEPVGLTEVPTPGMRYGANADLRVDHEDVWIFRKPQPEGITA
jgi:SAM-dependent methyltransferase